MKYLIFCILIPLYTFGQRLCAQEFEWVKFFQGTGNQLPASLRADDRGNQFVAFNYLGSTVFDSMSVSHSTLRYRGLIVKQDSSGETQWFRILHSPFSSVTILGGALNTQGHYLSVFSCPSDVIIGNDTLQNPGGGDVLFYAEFNSSGSLLNSRVLLKTPDLQTSATDAEGVFCDERNDLFLTVHCDDTLVIQDTSGTHSIMPGSGKLRVIRFSGSGSKFEWVRSFPENNFRIKRVDTDLDGDVFIGTDWYNGGTFGFAGNTLAPPQIRTAAVFILNAQGQDQTWFAITASGDRTSLHDLSVYDNNSLFIGGQFLGDSALFDTLWKKTKAYGAYQFIARFDGNGNLFWVKHEDTSYSTVIVSAPGSQAMTQYYDEYVYLSYLNTSAAATKPILYDGQVYSPLSGVSSYGMTMKLDAFGNVLWAFRTQRPFVALGTDLFSSLYFTGSWYSGTLKLGSHQATHSGSEDAFVGKTYDYAIFRGDISNGPYCAGDTIRVPYTVRGQYGDSNYFIAELSDEDGFFTGNERELGRIQRKDSGTVPGLLPLFQVAGSQKYRIRVRSTHPVVQSFYRVDSLRLLIYSRDKADPGPTETICRGDTLMLNTFGGTRWQWSPAARMNDSTLRQPLVWPDSATTYRIVISDSSGCGENDTAYKAVLIRSDPSIQAIFTDTLACPKDSLNIPVRLFGGDSLNYRVRWYRIGGGAPVLIRTATPQQASDTLRVQAMPGDTAGTVYRAILSDDCSPSEDTVQIRIRSYSHLKLELPFTDTLVCKGTGLTLLPALSGGRAEGHFVIWQDSASGIMDTGTAFSFTVNSPTMFRVFLDDGCMPARDSAVFRAGVFDSLYLELGTSMSILTDTLLCPGEKITLYNRLPPGNNRTLNYRWEASGQLLSFDSQYRADSDSLFQHFQPGNDSGLYLWVSLDYSNSCYSVSDSMFIRVPGPVKDRAGGAFANVSDSFLVEINFVSDPATNLLRYELYRLDAAAPVFIAALSYSGGGVSHQVTDSVYTLDSSRCYAIVTIDSCGNRAYSDTFCTVQLEGKAGNQTASLNWTLPKDSVVRQYVLRRNGNNWDTLATLGARDSVFIDTLLPCNIPQLYRLVAEIFGNGRQSSDPLTLIPFDTLAPAPVILKAASVQLNRQIQLSWYPSASPDVKYYEIWRDTGSGFGLLTTVTNDTVFLDTGADVSNRDYRYSIIGVDSCNSLNRSGTSDTAGNIRLRLQTGACVPLVRLNWDAVSSGNTAKYRIWRSKDTLSFILLDSVSGNQTDFNDSTVSEGNRYTYRVEAISQFGFGAFTDTSSRYPWVFPAPDMGKLLATTVVRTGVPDGQVQLDWMKWDMTDSFARGYYIWHDDGTSERLIHTETDLNVTGFIHDSINTQTALNHYSVSTYNLCHESNDTSQLFRQSENSDEHRPVLLSIDTGNLQSTLRWTSYLGFSVDRYEIWREEDFGGFNWYAQTPANDTSYLDTLVRCGHRYRYEIRAYQMGGPETSRSNRVESVAFDTLPPGSVKIVYASILQTGLTSGEIELHAQTVQEENRSHYLLYRSENNGPFLLVDSVAAGSGAAFTYTDDGLNTYSHSYRYLVRAKDSCGNLGMEADTHATVLLRAQAVNNAIHVRWNAYEGFDLYDNRLERQSNGGPWQLVALPPMEDTLFMDSSVSCNTRYTYRITCTAAVGGYQSQSNTDTATSFSVDPPGVPVLLRSTVVQTAPDAGIIRIEWEPGSGRVAYYELERSENGTDWQSVASNLSGTYYEDENLNTQNLRYYYRLTSVDSCDNRSQTPSGQHAAVFLMATPGEEDVALSWSAYQGWTVDYYRVYRNGSLIDSVPGISTEFTDSHLLCTEEYGYRIEALFADRVNVVSFSNEIRARPLDTRSPETPELLYATVLRPNRQVEIAWTRPPDFDLEGYELRIRGGAVVYMNTLADDTVYVHSFEKAPRPLCYEVRSRDLCGNLSDESNPGCILFPDVMVMDQYNLLTWSDYEQWPDGISHYEIYRSEDSVNWSYLGEIAPGINEFKDENLSSSADQFVYQVIAISNSDPVEIRSASMAVTVILKPVIWIPNSFTPQQSPGYNDLFAPEGAWFRRYEMQVYNRWGTMVYATRESEAWDGTYLGKPVPEGAYLYRIVIYSHTGVRKEYKGVVHVIR